VEDSGAQVVIALVPAVEIARYGTDLRALAGGYGSFHAEHDHYDVAPAQVVEHFARPRVLTS
jgi:elongation factor G